ncbi:MAG: beta-galactosidase [Planctomycetota bacterium]
MIYIGTQYFRAPTPAEEDWDRDTEQARLYGLDYVRFWLMWNWYCRAEGEYDFSSLRRLLDTCERHGMKVLMLVNLESVPAWLAKKHPEAVYVDSEDRLYRPESVGNTPSGGFPGLCFHNDPVVEAGKDYIRELVSAFADHPAIECWEPHNEPMFEAGRYNDNIYCYCDASVAAFRDYLRDKYGDIDALNADWRRNYGEFAEVEPPRRRGAYNDWMDWRLFHLESLVDTLRWRIGAIRENDPDHYVMLHTRGGSGVTRNLAKEGIDDHRMAELVDKYGTAAFPQCGPEHEYFLAMSGARCAAKGKEFWMAELQAGPYGMGVHRSDAEPACEYCGSSTMEGTIDLTPGGFDPGQVTAERLAMWSWSGIAQGGKGVMYWQYRNESFGLEYGFGLTRLDGSPHPRLEAVNAFKAKLKEYEDLFDDAAPPPNEVAIAWDPRNDIVNWTAVGCTDAVKNSIKGIHLAQWHTDYPVDVVRLDCDVVDDDFGRYRIIYLPFSPFISSASAEKLKAFVEGGGTVVAEASAAQFDDGMGVCPVVPGQGLDELFGCRRAEIRTMPAELMPRLRVGRRVVGARMHKEVLEPIGTGVVIGEFTTGEPAVVQNSYGDGRAIYIGTNPFMAYREDPDSVTRKWVNDLNRGVARYAWTDVPAVVARVLRSGDRRLVFLLNTVEARVPVTLHVAWDGSDAPTAREILEETPVQWAEVQPTLQHREELPPYGTRVYVLEPAGS